MFTQCGVSVLAQQKTVPDAVDLLYNVVAGAVMATASGISRNVLQMVRKDRLRVSKSSLPYPPCYGPEDARRRRTPRPRPSRHTSFHPVLQRRRGIKPSEWWQH